MLLNIIAIDVIVIRKTGFWISSKKSSKYVTGSQKGIAKISGTDDQTIANTTWSGFADP